MISSEYVWLKEQNCIGGMHNEGILSGSNVNPILVAT